MRYPINRWWIWIGLCSMVFGQLSCRDSSSHASPFFEEIFPDSKSRAFRGIHLGDSLAKVKSVEPASPQFEDPLGVAFKYDLEEGKSYWVEYYSGQQGTSHPSQVVSIVVNILLQDEIIAHQLYQEIAVYFQQKYGLSTGTYGEYRWEINQIDGNEEILLRLHGNKGEISINFIDQQAET